MTIERFEDLIAWKKARELTNGVYAATRQGSFAKGSAAEVRSQLYTALDVGHISQEEFQNLCNQSEDVAKLIMGLIKALRNSSVAGSRYHNTKH